MAFSLSLGLNKLKRAMQKGNIRVQTENIFPIIKKFLYSDHDIFIRELVSNAVDATQKLKTLSSIGEAKGDLGDLSIDIQLDKEAKTITISDKGVGMTAEEVDKYLNQVAFSGAEEFLKKYGDEAGYDQKYIARVLSDLGISLSRVFRSSSDAMDKRSVTASYPDPLPRGCKSSKLSSRHLAKVR